MESLDANAPRRDIRPMRMLVAVMLLGADAGNWRDAATEPPPVAGCVIGHGPVRGEFVGCDDMCAEGYALCRFSGGTFTGCKHARVICAVKCMPPSP